MDPFPLQFDAWGRRADRLITCSAWHRLKEICAEEGIVSIGYEGRHGAAWDRVHQIAKLFLFSPSAGLVTCPMAMTDGAAKTFKVEGGIQLYRISCIFVSRPYGKIFRNWA